VSDVSWMLSHEQELEICRRGITEAPTTDVTMDANIIYNFCERMAADVHITQDTIPPLSGSAFTQMQMRFMAEKMEAIISFFINVYTPAITGTSSAVNIDMYSRLYSIVKNSTSIHIKVR